MHRNDAVPEPTPSQLMAVIGVQTEIAGLGLDLNAVMTLVAEKAMVMTEAAGAIVELADGDVMVYRAVAGGAASLLGLRLARATSLSGLSVATAETLRCDDSETDPRVDREACRKVGLRSMVCMPLLHNGAAVGVLKVYSPEANAFSESDVRLLGLMGGLIASAMYNAVRFGKDELFLMATRDPLTGLANRALFLDRLRHGIAKSAREKKRLAVLMIDMDGLKPINDNHGHRAGDAALREVGRRLSVDARQSDTVARLGGDEYAVILSAVEDRAGVESAMARISERCGGPFAFEGTALAIGASIGAAVYPEEGATPDALVERADQEMYAVKRARKAGRISSPHSPPDGGEGR